MDSSRIFIKGLPPNLSEDEFRKHFSAKQPVTDAKLIPHRRIGYVGYKTPEEAVKAVKYFNKSFIRMSKIAVEVARPISDTTLPTSRKVQREEANNVRAQQKVKAAVAAAATAAAIASLTSGGQKRKRTDVDESDPKLQEYLELMGPSKKTWAQATADNALEEPPTKVQAIEIPEDESDNEYEMVPKKTKKVEVAPASVVQVAPAMQAPAVQPIFREMAVCSLPPEQDPDDDDDWLRSRTNRLLDVMDPEEIAAMPNSTTMTQPPVVVEQSANQDVTMTGITINEKTVVDEALVEESAEAAALAEDPNIESIKSNGRLFVRNLPYSATEEDLRDHFSKFGSLEEVHLPLDASGASKGFVLVQFEDTTAAADAYHNLDGEPFQGRLLHILPAAAKRENKLDEFEIAKLPLKKQKQIKKKAEAASATFNWNSLYMNQDAVNSSMAERLGVSKADLLDPTSADAGIKQAIAETSIIQETKAYFVKNGVDLDAFKKKERGDTSILVKNFPYGMTLEELRKMFEEFGQVLRVLMPPTGTIAIVEFAQPPQARAAFASLAYRRMKDSVLFLEKAPKDLFSGAPVADPTNSAKAVESTNIAKLSASDLLELKSVQDGTDTSTLYVRNLNFTTTSDRLTEIFKPLEGFMSARVNTKTDPKKPGQVLSMGFGFVEFRSKAQANAAMATLDGYDLDNHKLVIKASHRGVDAAEERKKEEKNKKMAGKRTKIIVKNLPFEASKKDIYSLLGTYGKLRSVRVPKKFDSSARGFAFAEFVTAREAENALESLKDTHLLGRRLVLEFAAEDAADAEEEIEKMQKKVGRQVNKVAVQKLTGGGRKKFEIAGNDHDDE